MDTEAQAVEAPPVTENTNAPSEQPGPTSHEQEAFKRRDAALAKARDFESKYEQLSTQFGELQKYKEAKEFEELQSKAKGEEDFKALIQERDSHWEKRVDQIEQEKKELEQRFRDQRRDESLKAQLADAGFRDDWKEFVGRGSLGLEEAFEGPDGSLDIKACLPLWREKMPEAFMAKPNEVSRMTKPQSQPSKGLSPTQWIHEYATKNNCSFEEATNAYSKYSDRN